MPMNRVNKEIPGKTIKADDSTFIADASALTHAIVGTWEMHVKDGQE